MTEMRRIIKNISILICTTFIVVFSVVSCTSQPNCARNSLHVYFDKPSAGYEIEIISFPQGGGWLYHFQRGDSVDCFVPLTTIPKEIESMIAKAPLDTSFHTDLVFSVEDKMYKDFFFKDVNFDNEPEFVVTSLGNDWQDFSCYDLVERRAFDPRVALDFVTPIDFDFYGNYGIYLYPEDRLLKNYNGPKFNYKDRTIILSGYSGAFGKFEFKYQYVGANQYKELWYKDYETVPIYDKDYNCIDTYQIVRTYRPHATIKDSLVLVSEKRVSNY